MRRWLTLLLALLVIGLTTGFLFVNLDEHGVLRPPPPIGPPSATPYGWWMDRLTRSRRAEAGQAPSSYWPASSDGIDGALRSRADLLQACHAAWIHGDSSAPRQATARIHIQHSAHGLGHVTGVDIDTRAGGVQTMEACVTEALAPLVFSGVPDTGLVVLWTLSLPDEP